MRKHITLIQAEHMAISELAKLNSQLLLSLCHEADKTLAKAKAVKEWLQGAVAKKYEDRAKEQRQQSGKDTGVIRLEDEGIEVICDLPKKVEWDQAQLAKIVGYLEAEGQNPAEYVEQEFRVFERKYNAWPSGIRALFEKARVVKVGNPSYKLVHETQGLGR